MNYMRSPVSKPIPVPKSPEATRSASDLLADFLRLKISANTRRNYSKAIADFCRRNYDSEVSNDLLVQFLSLHQPEAVYQVLQYRQLLIEAKLAPSTINVRLSALKSFIDYARQAEQCSFNLADVRCLKVESYGDTTGIAVAGFKQMLQIPDRNTVKGIRDYALLRLLWDNALRRNEICSLDVGDFDKSGRLSILGKGKIQKARSTYRQQLQSRSHNGWQLETTIKRPILYSPASIGAVRDIGWTVARFIAWCESLVKQPESIR